MLSERVKAMSLAERKARSQSVFGLGYSRVLLDTNRHHCRSLQTPPCANSRPLEFGANRRRSGGGVVRGALQRSPQVSAGEGSLDLDRLGASPNIILVALFPD